MDFMPPNSIALKRFVLLAAFLGLPSGSVFGKANSSIAILIGNSELQLETKSQCRELLRAFSDLSEKSVKEMKSARYSDYEGNKSKWSIVDLLNHHLVLPSSKPITEKPFFRALKSVEMKNSIRTLRGKLGNCDDFAGQ